MTLIELAVAIAVLGMMAGLTALAFPTRREATERTVAERIADERRRAMRTGVERTVLIADSLDARVLTLLPDGRVLGARDSAVDAMTGRPPHAAR